jgi:hypothetical protein
MTVKCGEQKSSNRSYSEPSLVKSMIEQGDAELGLPFVF